MSALSPLTKSCPRCQATVVAEIAFCACGHHFGVDAAVEKSSSDLVVQAEALYESHLRARLQRAVRATRFAKLDALRDPRDPRKTTQLREAEQEVKLLETQLVIQTARTADARNAAVSAPADPTQSFRTVQTIKADETFELLKLKAAAERFSTEANGVFHTVQTEKTRTLAPLPSEPQRCPGCSSVVTLGMTRCGCGYVLTTASDKISDFLSTEELAALRGS